MKRFYCVVCKKMKRAQQWPDMIQNVKSASPEERVGTCNRHSRTASWASPIARTERKVGA